MSMFTPSGIGGQFRVTNYRGKRYGPPQRPHERARILALVLGVSMLFGGSAWAIYHFLLDDRMAPARIAACETRAASPVAAPPAPAVPVTPLTTMAPAQVTVNVYNGTKRTGLAKEVADELKKRGFVIGKVSNERGNAEIADVALVRSDPRTSESSTRLAAEIEGARVVPEQRSDTSVDLVIGNGFTALRDPAAVAAVLSPPPPPVPAPAPSPSC